MPGAAGLVLTGGIVAVAAAEYLGVPGAGLDAPDPSSIGRPSEAALAMVAPLDAGETGGGTVDVDGSPGNSDNSTRD
jgi:hypothetical protein